MQMSNNVSNCRWVSDSYYDICFLGGCSLVALWTALPFMSTLKYLTNYLMDYCESVYKHLRFPEVISA